MERICFIINPISGTSSKEEIPHLIETQFSPKKFQTDILFTEYPKHASELTRQALVENADYVVAVGGDGTVNEVAKAMIRSNAALGIIPVGSGNGLARDLSIPLDIKKAIKVIIDGYITPIDYCKANNHIFFCTCGVGFDAIISERFAEGKHRGALTYVKNAITEYLKYRPETYEIFFEDEVITEKAFLVTCANASQYGNNAFIAPHANIRDGLMDVAILSPINPLDVGPLVVQLFTRQIEKNNKIKYYQTHKLILKRKKSGVMHIDGEPVNTGKKVTIESFHAGLNVIVPENPKPAAYDIPSFIGQITRWLNENRPKL